MSLSLQPSLAGGVVCRACQKVNPTRCRFCSGCGQNLREPCPQCGAECAADGRFCGSCGWDIQRQLADKTRELEAAIASGRRLAAEFRLDEAIASFQQAAAFSDPRLHHLVEQAREEITRLQAELQRHRQDAESALSRARRAFEVHEYEAAVSELAAVPAPLRCPQATALLARARSAKGEVLELCGKIRAALAARQFDGLPRLVERLLALKPDHEQARTIAEQLQTQLVRSARKSLAAGEYQLALDQLGQVPPTVRSPQVHELVEIAGEVVTLFDGIRGAPLADKSTLSLARRLVALVPGNADAIRLAEEVAEKAKTRPIDVRLGAPDLAPDFAPASRQPVGPPIDWLARPSLTAAGDAAAALDAHPGQFFVALGLALQAMGMGDIALDLIPQEKTGLLTLDLTKSLSLGRKCIAAWGLDLSGRAMKAVKLVAEGSAVQIAAAEFLQSNRPLDQFAKLAGDLKGTRIAVGLPGHRVLGRFFELPPMPASKTADAIAYEAGHQLPIPLAQLCWASHVHDAREGSAADPSPQRILVVAARASHVRERIGAFKAAGICPDLLTTDCLALHNALVHEMFTTSNVSHSPAAVCCLDVGAADTNVVISSPRCVWFRTIGVGGDQFTAQLARQLGLKQDQAELLKRDPAKARRYSAFRDALQPTLAQLASEVECSLANYARLFPDESVEHIYGLGGAFQTHGLLRQLRRGNGRA